MARRTTIVLTPEDELAIKRAAKAEGVTQSEIIRKGIRTVTSSYRRKPRPRTGWLRLTEKEREAIRAEAFGDYDER